MFAAEDATRDWLPRFEVEFISLNFSETKKNIFIYFLDLILIF